MNALSDIFGNKIGHGLERGGIKDLTDLILEWENIPKNFEGYQFKNLGKSSYEFVEYFLKVELP